MTIPGSKSVHQGVLSPLTHSSGSSGIGGSGLLGPAMPDGPFPMSGSFGKSNNLFYESAGSNSGQILGMIHCTNATVYMHCVRIL